MAADAADVIMVPGGGDGDGGRTCGQGGADLVLGRAGIVAGLWQLDHVVDPRWEIENCRYIQTAVMITIIVIKRHTSSVWANQNQTCKILGDFDGPSIIIIVINHTHTHRV